MRILGAVCRRLGTSWQDTCSRARDPQVRQARCLAIYFGVRYLRLEQWRMGGLLGRHQGSFSKALDGAARIVESDPALARLLHDLARTEGLVH